MGAALIIFSLALGGIFSSGAAAQQRPVPGGTLTIALAAEPSGLDPTTNPSAAIKRVVHYNLLEGLLKVDRNGRVVPALAISYSISKDGKEYTFVLHSGIKFHDGSPCTAEDVKFTFERLLDPKTAAPYRMYYEAIESIQAVDPTTVKFKMKKVDSNFLFNMARGDAVIVSKQSVDRLKSAPVGTGPFKFVEWKRGDSVIMAKNPDYYVKGLPYQVHPRSQRPAGGSARRGHRSDCLRPGSGKRSRPGEGRPFQSAEREYDDRCHPGHEQFEEALQ
jgi:peptide/nickel transport system substrate-binding protein